MRKSLAFFAGLIFVLAAVSCSVPDHQKTPAAAVTALIENVKIIKEEARSNKSKGEKTDRFQEASQVVKSLFENETKAKPVMAALMLMDVRSYEIDSESIDGDKAQVKVRLSYKGVGGKLFQTENAPQSREMTWTLEKKKGRWMISDIGGILSKWGR